MTEPAVPGVEERTFNLAARAMQRRFGASGTEEDIEAALSEFFAPILAEKEQEIERLRDIRDRRGAKIIELSDRALAAEAALAGERERVAGALVEWSKPQTMKLHAGEMTAGEVRTAQAILKGAAAAIRAQQD